MIRVLFIAFFLLFYTGCFNNGNKSIGKVSAPENCTMTSQNKYVYDVMHDSYLWYDHVPVLDYSDSKYSSLFLLLDDLKYKKYDRWSFVTTITSYNQYFEEGTFVGYGLSYSLTDNNKSAVINYVHAGSPADLGGIRRGYKIVAVNDVNISSLVSLEVFNYSFGLSKKGVERKFKIQRYDGSYFDVNLSKDLVTMNTILHKSIIIQDQKKIGYLVFNSFIQPALDELNSTFVYFKENNITDLILDLRYNGGGRVNIANELATLIGGEHVYGKEMQRFIHNDKYSSADSSEKYGSFKENALNLSKLYVITTTDTCSASELIINALRASNTGMEVVTIGEKTCGKPVGMYGHDFCDKHIAPIEFAIQNSDGYGDYFDGIKPECRVSDDVSRDFGDTNESMLKETLSFIKTGICKKSRTLIEQNRNINPLRGFEREVGAI
jgi:C-terminal processing protease CtpA/Prc